MSIRCEPVTLKDVVPLAIGGDHSITLPILRAVAAKHGPVALIHVDAHADVNDEMFGEKETHGTVFRRAYEEGLIKADKVYQIGIRGSGYVCESVLLYQRRSAGRADFPFD